jgi:hypothetical protein
MGPSTRSHRSSTTRTIPSPGWLALGTVLLLPGVARAQSQPEAPATSGGEGTTVAVAPQPPPAPYSLPWQLRPAAVGNVVRSDTSIAFYRAGEADGSTVASMLLATYKVTPNLAPLVRVGFVRNDDPNPTTGTGAAFVNPIIGLTAGWKLPADVRLSAFLGGTVPVGMGGGSSPMMDGTAGAVAKGIPARSAMDNAMFAVNYFTALGGVDAAWVAHDLTIQAEVTLLQLTRVRNEPFAPEASRTNGTAGLHVGYFVLPMLSLGGELRYQRWLSTPRLVQMNPKARDNTTFAVGPRFHFKVGKTTWLRPGVSFSAYLDEPMTTAKYSIVTIDLPLAF